MNFTCEPQTEKQKNTKKRQRSNVRRRPQFACEIDIKETVRVSKLRGSANFRRKIDLTVFGPFKS